MGYYIEAPKPRGKAEYICDNYQGYIIPQPIYFNDIAKDLALICVVSNGAFEAAAFCYDEQEFKAFSDPDDYRPKEWLLIKRQYAKDLTKYKGE